MRVHFLALLSTFVSLASLSSAHHENSVDSREEIIGEINERLERRRAGKWCCTECEKEFENDDMALGHEKSVKHTVYALKNRKHCPWAGKT
ncbi:hypothetical protein DFP72DRAFT_908926 [Ephemerocybe angulata]|uniref:C2H2-type domain-containing protein n=1 Tax=Ephemerocybe angulata TaxID=980116 RepID=A0A8H6HPT3_9AGAR|nr:hypothetical protein DFP72DRAFT_908926 [Tulosesus angulatus]